MEHINETWKSIDNFPNYQVSDQGRVRNIKTGKIFTGTRDAFGYMHVRLINPDGGYTLKKVHRLVAETFLPNPEGKPIIDHIDGDKTRNSLDNLRWFTYSENSRAYEDSHQGRSRVSTKSRKIAQYTTDGTLIATFSGAGEAAKATGLGRFGIHSACSGKLRTVNGFMWRFFDDEPEQSIPPFRDGRRRAVRRVTGGVRTEYPSVSAAADDIMKRGAMSGKTRHSVMMNISANLRGLTGTAYGGVWEYV